MEAFSNILSNSVLQGCLTATLKLYIICLRESKLALIFRLCSSAALIILISPSSSSYSLANSVDKGLFLYSEMNL